MHTVKISLTADQEIQILGHAVNIYDIQTVVLNGSGEITEVIKRRPRYSWFFSHAFSVLGVDKSILRGHDLENHPVIRITTSGKSGQAEQIVPNIQDLIQAFGDGDIDEQELTDELIKIEAAWQTSQ